MVISFEYNFLRILALHVHRSNAIELILSFSSVHQCQQKQEVLVVQSSTLESSLVKEREAHSKAKEERNGLKVISCFCTCLFVTVQHILGVAS